MRNTLAGLPPGPRLPTTIQSVIWFRSAQWLLDTCQARFGDMFTLRIANEGTWVVTSNPDVVKQVFTGDPRLLHAGEANRILLPVLGPNSVLLLDDGQHLRQRKLMLPAFHGERMQRYGGEWGQQCLMARRLVECGVEIVTTTFDGPLCGRVANWDDHAVNQNVFDALQFRIPYFDQAVAALIEDIYDRGLDKRLSQKIKLPVHVADDPLKSVVRGTGLALKHYDRYPFVMR